MNEGECISNTISKLQSYIKIKDGITLYWQFIDNDDSIDFMYEYNFKGWFSIGLGPDMHSVDMHVA